MPAVADDIGFVPAEADDLGFIPASTHDDLGFVPEAAPKSGFIDRAKSFLGSLSESQHRALSETLAAQKISNEKDLQWAETPLINAAPRDVLKMAPVLSLLGPEAAQGVAEAGSELIKGASSPAALAAIPAAIAMPEVAAAYFGVTGAKRFGEELGQATVDAGQGNPEQAVKHSVLAVASGAQALSPLAHALLPGSSEAIQAMERDRPPIIERSVSAPQADALEPSTVAQEAPPIIEQPAAPKPDALEPSTVPQASPSEAASLPPPATAEASAEARLGIMPPGVPEGVQAIKDTATKLDQVREGFRNLRDSKGVKEDIVRKFDAADNEAKISGEQTGNSLRLDLPSKADRDAVTFMVEANGDQAKLIEFASKVAGKSERALTAIRLAQKDWDRLAPIAERVGQLQDEQLRYEQENGIDPGNVEGYVRHVYDMDAMIGKGRPVLLSPRSGGGGVSTSFKKQRAFATYADAIEAGFKPKSFDIADLVQSRITIGEKLVNRTKWANSLSDMVDPAEGTPIVTDIKIQQPKGTQVAPMGYVRKEILPGVPIAVHEGYIDLIDALTGPSIVRANPIGRALLNGEAGVKHGLLLLDTFHAARMLYKELALTGKATHDLGRSLLEYADADLERAVQSKQITQQAADWARRNRPDAELLTGNGLNVGRISDALYKDVVANIPVIGKYNKWLFDKLTRGAMMQSAISELNRMRTLKPNASDAELAGLVAKNVNIYFGNIGRQGWLKSATFQDLARIVFLAPQWVEGMAKTELGAVKQSAQIPMDMARGRPFIVGTLAKGVGTGVLATFIANQFINMATRGHPTWDNPEHGHQLDAFIPDVTGKSPGFFLNPLSVFAELAHDAMRYYEDDPHALKAVSRIVGNKFSPLARAEEVLRTGKDWMGRDLQGSWDRVKEAGRALIPAPIPLQSSIPMTGKNSPPGSLQRQIFGSAGIKIEPVPTAESQLFNLSRKFKESKGIKEPTSEPSEYRDLNAMLKKEDWSAAKTAYEELLKGKGEKTIREHYRNISSRLYTGKRSLESEFKSTLTPEQEVLYDKAKEEREALRDKFDTMITK